MPKAHRAPGGTLTSVIDARTAFGGIMQAGHPVPLDRPAGNLQSPGPPEAAANASGLHCVQRNRCPVRAPLPVAVPAFKPLGAVE